MRKLAIVICFCILVLVNGCANKEVSSVGRGSADIDKTGSQKEDKIENNAQTTTEDQTSTDDTYPQTSPTKSEEDVLMQKAIVYYVDSNDIVQKKVVQIEVLNQDTLWGLLIEDGTVSKDSRVLSMSMNSDFQIDLDVNDAFGHQLRSLGTDGEYHLMECVINSYLETFSSKEIKITEQGQTLESGHVVYKGYSNMIEE